MYLFAIRIQQSMLSRGLISWLNQASMLHSLVNQAVENQPLCFFYNDFMIIKARSLWMVSIFMTMILKYIAAISQWSINSLVFSLEPWRLIFLLTVWSLRHRYRRLVSIRLSMISIERGGELSVYRRIFDCFLRRMQDTKVRRFLEVRNKELPAQER
jgi:hypothetical protein